MSDDIVVRDGYLYGSWQRPVNISAEVRDSIHDDDTAQKLGMRGGTVAGCIHLEQFPPLLLKAFGPRWFEQGTLSLYYTYATRDREEVRVVVGVPPASIDDAQVEVWMETSDEHTVCRGTASVGQPIEPTALGTLELENAAPDELRILAGLRAGDSLPPRDVTVTAEEVSQRLKVITEPLDWYQSGSPWGNPIVTPMLMFNTMRVDLHLSIQAVPFQGATELRNVAGPTKVGVPYRATGKLVCVGTSPKTEFYWFDACLEEVASGRRVAEMRMMRRFMKASSPLYRDED